MASNSFSFKVDDVKKQEIIAFYQYCKKDINNDLIDFKAADEEFTIQIYKNNTVLIQGNRAKDEYRIWNPIEILVSNDIENETDFFDHAGSDEVGCGDYFGPIVVAGTLIKKEDCDFLLSLGVKDSKQLSDEKIMKMAPEIIKRIKVKICIISNKKYNSVYSTQNYNLNKIKAYLHNFVLYKLVQENHFRGPVIVDQFCEERLYYRYLEDYKTRDIQEGIIFSTKAENKFLAVACASIVARYTFLCKIKEMEEHLKLKIPLGANKEVDEIATLLAREFGMDGLKNFVKYHFSNTKKVLQNIKSNAIEKNIL